MSLFDTFVVAVVVVEVNRRVDDQRKIEMNRNPILKKNHQQEMEHQKEHSIFHHFVI